MKHQLLLCCALCGGALAFTAPSCSVRNVQTSMMAAKKSKKSTNTNISLRGFGSAPAPSSAGKTGANTLLRDPITQGLYSWLEAAGVDLRNIALADFDGLRGVMALRDIKKGQSIIEIPSRAAIDLGDELADPALPALELLKVWCNPENRHAPYLASLPQPGGADLTTTDFFTDAELDMLQWPPLVDETRKRLQACESLYNDVIKLQVSMGFAFHGKQLTLDDLKWAVFIVVSRVLTVMRADDVRYAKLLIPGIDMFNHCAASPHKLIGRVGSALKIVAGEDIAVGSQINIAYSGGRPRSDRFLQDYGFLDSKGCSAEDDRILGGTAAARCLAEGALSQTTLEEDQQLLAGGKLSANETLAVQFRAALKQKLQNKQ